MSPSDGTVPNGPADAARQPARPAGRARRLAAADRTRHPQVVRRQRGAALDRPRRAAGRGRRAHRAERVGQDHGAALAERPRDARRRHDLVRRRARARLRDAAAEGRAVRAARPVGDGVPAAQPVPAHDRAAERHRGPDPGAARAEGAGPSPRRSALLERVGPRREARRVPVRAVGRAAAARRHRARARAEARPAALRRADERARPRARGRGAARSSRSSPTRAGRWSS